MEVQDTIPIDQFVNFVRGLQGQEFVSRTGRAKFTAEVTDKGMCFVPLSTGKPRQHTTPHIKFVLEQFNRTKGFAKADYPGIVNATYQFALISLYLNHHNQAG